VPALDGLEHVVEVVRDAASEPAQGLHLRRLGEPGLAAAQRRGALHDQPLQLGGLARPFLRVFPLRYSTRISRARITSRHLALSTAR
jgi:hypothetical protein